MLSHVDYLSIITDKGMLELLLSLNLHRKDVLSFSVDKECTHEKEQNAIVGK